MRLDVRLWHKSDMLNALTNVRFWGQGGHGRDLSVGPLMTQSGHRVGPTCEQFTSVFWLWSRLQPSPSSAGSAPICLDFRPPILPVLAVTAALWEYHRRACNLRKFQLHVRSFVGGFGRRTAPNNLNLSVGDRRLISEAHPRDPFEEVRGSELHLDF